MMNQHSCLLKHKQQKLWNLVSNGAALGVFVLSFFFTGCQGGLQNQPSVEPVSQSQFYGVNQVSAKVAEKVLSPVKGDKPLVLFFSSALCYDCKKMAPVFNALIEQHPEVVFQKVDVLSGQEKYGDILNAFAPKTVPTMLFITRKAETHAVLYNLQTASAITKEIKAIQKTSDS